MHAFFGYVAARLVRARLAAFVFSAALAPAFLFAQSNSSPVPLPNGVSYATSVEGINEYRLANGLRVLLFPDPTQANITVNITYMVGSRHEDYGETGMAHLLEHLLFMGSTRHTGIKQELKDHGTRFNGTTSFDRTNYFETFQATGENLEWAIDLESDRMVNSFVAKKDLDTEMTVVRNEFERGENMPTAVLWKRTLAAAYQWHNYANATIGARSDIERVPIDRLQAFYRHFYQPDNALLVVAGKIDEAATLALVHRHFSPIPKPARPLRRTYTAEPTQDGERSVTLRRVGDVQGLNVMYHVPAGTDPEFAAVAMGTLIFGTTPSGRLHKALVEGGLASYSGAYVFQLMEPGVAVAYGTVRTEKSLDDAVKTTLAIVEGAKERPFTDDEVSRAKTEWQKDVDVMLNDSQQVALRLSEWQSMGDWRMLFLTRDRVKAVTREQIQAAAERYFVQSNRTVGRFIPDAKPVRAEIPDAPNLADALKDYRGDATIAQGEAFDPSPENIDRRVELADLPGGLKLSLLPKKTRGARVNVAIWFEFGDEAALRGRRVAGELAGDMLMRGTTRHTRQQISDEFDRLKADMWIDGWPSGAWAGGQTTRENLAPALALLAEIAREPTFPEAEFTQLVQQMLTNAENQKSDPAALASLALRRHLNAHPPGHVSYVPTIDEKIADFRAAKLEDAKQFYRDFYGASNCMIAVVGDFDPAAVKAQLAELFSTWRSPRPYQRLSERHTRVDPLVRVIETPDKANANWEAALKVKMNDADPDYPAMVLGTYMFGAGFGSRLTTRIRDKEGLSYGVGASFSAPTEDDNARFSASAICAPENCPRVEVAFKDEFAKILSEGFTDAEVAAAKKSWRQSRQVSRAKDGELATRLTDRRYWGRTMTSYDADLEAKVSQLTPAQILAVMKKHLDPAQLNIVRAGDFKRAKVNWSATTAAGQ